MRLVELDDVGLLFHVRRLGRISLKEYLLQGWFRQLKKNSFEVQALEHIDLRIEEGDRLVGVDITEFEKLEGCVTCLSVRVRG